MCITLQVIVSVLLVFFVVDPYSRSWAELNAR
jgi:hypothetical protein